MRIGLDIGSTTIKCVVLDKNEKIIYSLYERHLSKIIEKISEVLVRLDNDIIKGREVKIAFSGSAGMGIAEGCDFPFIQEVYATRVATKRLHPATDVVIELGGEDAKILFLSDTMEVRMNGSCAGGTGAFIDQMATLFDVPTSEFDKYAANKEKIYTIASRCGVFAKTDIQPLLNQGARKTDLIASINYAVVNQTIAGLAQGREIEGNILYLGGPLTFFEQLKKSFDDVLKTKGVCPENSLYFVALGAAYCSSKEFSIKELIEAVENYQPKDNFDYREALFADQKEYDEFKERHNLAQVPIKTLVDYDKPCYIGIDAGSTTLKVVVIGEEEEVLFTKYIQNTGNPVPLVKTSLEEIYSINSNIDLRGGCVTGYGEDIIKTAFAVDYGVVETIAHFTAAKKFKKDVEFIIDIGGQDIKCFKIHNGIIDNIFLNEACSSGCGSFLQTFANALNYEIGHFSEIGLFAKRPVNLGSRCTVFMNSAVKQAQKDGAKFEDISAGLSMSVVKNALYKVIRAGSPDELGRSIVVQGGTFLNDAVLRSFELELGVNVVRPSISGLMGAYGAALYAKSLKKDKSTILDLEQLSSFEYKTTVANCNLCNNSCRLTINTFSNKRKSISGNRCDRPITNLKEEEKLNIYDYKLKLINSYESIKGSRGQIGIPLGLNMFEMLPFWNAFFTHLDFEVVTSPKSDRKLYLYGQNSIPSDTVCFPAKLIHGHVKSLIRDGVKTIFYPCMTYNFNEQISDNHYNCPVVAYYPEVIKNNMKEVLDITFIKDYIGVHRRGDFPGKMHEIMNKYFSGITLREVKQAATKAYETYNEFLLKIKQKGEEIISRAREANIPIIVLAGRPYHVDPEINHGIDRMMSSFNVAIISEEVICDKLKKPFIKVLNQWTYHARLYNAAKYIATQKDMHLIQLVSFGCGVDAITSDEIRDILEEKGKIYTQIKIDEISNLGAVKIRIRSLLAALQQEVLSNDKI